MFDRGNYYSPTEVCKIFKISPKRFKALLLIHYVPVISNVITFGTYYTLTAKYYLKSDIQFLMKDQNQFIIKIRLDSFITLFLAAGKYNLIPNGENTDEYLFSKVSLKQLIDNCIQLRVSDLAGGNQNDFRDNTLKLFDFVKYLETEMQRIDGDYKKQLPELKN